MEILSKLYQSGQWDTAKVASYSKQASEARADWMDEIRSIHSGPVKNAAAAGSDFTRTVMRETGIARKIIDFQIPEESKFMRHPTEKYRYLVNEIENNLPLPVVVNFDAAATQFRMSGTTYVVRFFDITSREFVENVRSLEVFDNDPRDYYAANTIKDLQTVEDVTFFNEIDSIVGSVVGGYSTLTGEQQYQQINTPAASNDFAFNRTSITKALQIMTGWRLPLGQVVVNAKTFQGVMGLQRTEVGGDLSQKLFIDGASAIEQGKMFGKSWLGTIKSDLILDDTLYLCAEPNWLGVCYEKTPPTMYIEKKMDILKFLVRETIAMKIASALGVAKVKLALV